MTTRAKTFNGARRTRAAKEEQSEDRRIALQVLTPQNPGSLGAFRARSAGDIPGWRRTPKSRQ